MIITETDHPVQHFSFVPQIFSGGTRSSKIGQVPLFLIFLLFIIGCSSSEPTETHTSQAPPTYQFSHLLSTDEFEGERLQSQSMRDLLEHHIGYYLDEHGFVQVEDHSDYEFLVYFVVLDEDSYFTDEGWPYTTNNEFDHQVTDDSVNFVIDLVDSAEDSLVYRGTSRIDLQTPNWIQSELPGAVEEGFREF